ncbi:hypothetical protein [Streptomyces mirabilis]|uniref:hypothetical protein n=1 Tax=Streptomyces mirabilis TaxID=68239 RepID=UPI0033DD29CD
MGSLTITWTLRHQGWAYCAVRDDQGEAVAIASDITGGPEQLLRALVALLRGADEAQAEFEAEPQVFRWFFRQVESKAHIRLVLADDHEAPADAGTLLWEGRHPITAFAQAAVSAFDHVADELGDEEYASQWGRPLPRPDLDTLRALVNRSPTSTPDTDSSEPRRLAPNLRDRSGGMHGGLVNADGACGST